jgi:hypothetical protein
MSKQNKAGRAHISDIKAIYQFLWCRGVCLSSWETPGSILGRTSTQGLKIIEKRKSYLYIDISKWLDFRVFWNKDVQIVGTSDPLSIGQ